MQVENRVIEQHKRKFKEFISADETEGRYIEKLRQCVTDKKFRFILNLNEVRALENELAAKIIRQPREYIIALQGAATESAKTIEPAFEKVLKSSEIQVGFDGSLGTHSVSPRGLNYSLLNTLVEVEGIVTKCSNVKPKLMRAVLYCPETSEYSRRDYRDNTSLDIGMEISEEGGVRLPTSSAIPTKDSLGNELELEHGLCRYKDYQYITLQEMPEKAKVGQLPRSVDVILEHDLVDRAKPGDRVMCVGVYRSLPPQDTSRPTSGQFRTVLICNNISIIGQEIGAVRLTTNDVRNIRELSKNTKILEMMAQSLCPSIYGHEFIKRALILQLLGGCERNLENGTHLRGDMNIMMVGDPSTAKSQLLRAIIDIAPLAISTTGRGSSGVGLTAAVTSDAETGEKRLEAGAMVLADRGVVCIDEFDKMSENDRVAIHEVMEQQTVTIAKAGIHAALNARCSVLAAANPVYGQYDKSRRPQDNIGLPDSLLSRFDLLFIVLDQLDPTLDRRLSEHVICSHLYRKPGTIMEPESLNQASSINLDETSDTAVDTPVWQRGGRNAAMTTSLGSTSISRHSNSSFSNNSASSLSSSSSSAPSGPAGSGGRAGDVLTKEFLRKYIHFAKNRMKPVLSDLAMQAISHHYADMRTQQTKKNLPITARTLETIIRLASASAKCRLSPNVEETDVEVAMELMNYVLFHEVGGEGSNSGGSGSECNGEGADAGLHDGSGFVGAAVGETPSSKNTQQTIAGSVDLGRGGVERESEGYEEEKFSSPSSGGMIPLQTQGEGDLCYRLVVEAITRMQTTNESSILISELLQRIQTAVAGSSGGGGGDRTREKGRAVEEAAVRRVLEQLERDNKVMMMEDDIQLI